MKNRDKMDIRVEVADKTYRMSIVPEDEEKVRRAALKINNEIKELRKRYETSYIDYLAMAALKISIDNEANIERLTFSTERLRIREITSELETILNKGETE